MRYRSRHLVLTSFLWLFVSVSLAVLVTGCSDDSAGEDDVGCTGDEECASDEICLQGMCVVQGQAYCSSDGDCPSGPYECVDQVCSRTDFDTGTDTGTDADSTGAPQPDTHLPDDDITPGDAPQVESVSPAPGASGVAVDTPIEVTFTEPMDPFSITFYSVQLRDANNRTPTIEVDYDEDSRTATINPLDGLRAASGYTIHVESLARDFDGNGVAPEFESTFYTAFDEPAEHGRLVETFAPVIYQGIADDQGSGPNGDIPTLITFDDNQNAADNGANSRRAQAETTAHVYYHLSETPQYYFIHYILYYPSRYDTGDDSRAEHDFAGAVFVIDRATEELLLVEGVQLLESGEEALAYKPSGSPISLRGDGISMSLSSFDAATLEDDTHYPMYVPGGAHETCFWHDGGDNSRCLHSAGQFRGDAQGGVVLRPGDTAQSYAEATQNADSGHAEMSYKLVPLAEEIWARRGDYTSDGLFEVPLVYDPAGDDRPAGFDAQQPHVLPMRLQSNTTQSFGRMPFAWLPNPGRDNQGQWLLDPVFILSNRYSFGEQVSTDYCHNVFFEIDRRDDGSLPNCGSH